MPSSHASPRGLRVRKIADHSGGDEAKHADLPGAPPGTWPLAGVVIDGDVPEVATIPLPWARRAAAEGWVELENSRVVQRPAGPPQDPTRDLHTFTHADTVIIHTGGGGIRYRVVHQPDKYHVEGDEAEVTTQAYRAGDTRVDWFFVAELEN